MKTNYCIIPFFHYHRTDDSGKKVLVNLSRFIRSREPDEPDVIQILKEDRNGKTPRILSGSRCVCTKISERFTETGQKIEEYGFVCVLPTKAELTWDDQHKRWSYKVQIGRNTIVYCPKPSTELPINGSSAQVKWEVKPFRVEYVSNEANFFIIRCQLMNELTSQRAKNRHCQKGYMPA